MPNWESNNQIRTDSVVIEMGSGISLVKSRDDLQPKNKYTLSVASTSTPPVLYGTTTPLVAGLLGQVYHQTSTGNNTGVIMNTWTYDGTVWYNETQPIDLTRTQLIALRAAAQLRQSQHYLITDHVQGRLLAGTTILLHAISNNELSESVVVNTTYDNEGWFGLYNIDTALVTELRDNRSNIAKGIGGTEVANFDWGNVNITNCIVDNATWTTTIGSALLRDGLKVIENAILITTGAVLGDLTNTTIAKSATVNLTAASLSIRRSLISGTSTSLNAATHTSGGVINHTKIEDGSVVNISNTSSSFSTDKVTILKTSTIAFSGVTTGALSITNTDIFASTINKLNLSLTTSISGSKIYNSTISHTTGTITLTAVIMEQSATIAKNTNTGILSISNSSVLKNSSITHSGLSTMNINRTIVDRVSNITLASGSNGAVAITDVLVDGNSSVQKTATSSAGTLSVTGGTNVLSASNVFCRGTGNLSISQCSVNGSSTISTAGISTRNYIVTRVIQGSVSGINLQGTGIGINDNIQDSTLNSRGRITMSATGAVANSITSSVVYGANGIIQITGGSSGQTVQECKADSALISISNCTATQVHNFISARTGGTVSLTNLTVVKQCTNIDTYQQGVINVSGTVAGNISNVVCFNLGQVNISGTAGAITGVLAEQGVVAINGGASHNRIIKKMTGTLTTGNFNQTNIIAITPNNVTCTAANTNRATYLGVTNLLPII
jgi:hypothetical protein